MSAMSKPRVQREPWVRMRIDLHEDPTVHRVSRWLVEGEHGGTSNARWTARLQIVGLLLVVWGHFRRGARENLLPGHDLTDVDEWTRTPGFGAALAAEGWIVEDADGLRLIDPAGYVGSSKNDREHERDRKRASRGRPNACQSLPDGVPRDNMREALGDNSGHPEGLSVSVSDHGSGSEERRHAALRTLIDRGGIDERQAHRVEERLDAALAEIRRVYVSTDEQFEALELALSRRLAGHDPRRPKDVRSLWCWLFGTSPTDLVPAIQARIDKELDA